MYFIVKIFHVLKEIFHHLIEKEKRLIKPDSFWAQASKRIMYPFILLIGTLIVGSLGYWVIGMRLEKTGTS